jgi:hypothetical protein
MFFAIIYSSSNINVKESPCLTLSYSSKINGYLYPQRVSMPLKKYKKRYVSEGNASHPVRCDSLLQFSPCFEFELAGSGAAARADKNGSWAHFKFEKSTPNDHYYLQWAVPPGQIPQQILLQRAGTP